MICKRNNDKYKDCPEHQQMKKDTKTRYHKTEKGQKQRFVDGLRGLFRFAINTYGNGKKMISKKYGIDYEKCYLKLNNDAKQMGYTIQELKDMEFHIDHIIPTIMYDFRNHEDIKNCWNPLNLRWLSQHDNCTKSSNIRPEDLEIIKTLPREIYPRGMKESGLV